MKKEIQNQKELYEKAEIDLIRIECHDVITTSETVNEDDLDDWTHT